MRKKAWVYQIKSQVKKHGAAKAAWNVGWIDPDAKRRTKSCGPGRRGKSDAEKLADKIHSQIVTGTYESNDRKLWSEFYAEYESRITARMESESRRTALQSLINFQRIVQPGRVRLIDSKKIDEFVAKRQQEKGRFTETVSPATINRELRYLRASLRIAHDWGYIDKVPKIRFVRQPEKIPTFVTPEHFAAIYKACRHADCPEEIRNVDASDWWRALLVMAYMTGWRISQILALKWDDVDLEEGTAISHAENNKGRRDVVIPLHPVIIEHLRKLEGSFETFVFPWNHGRRFLWIQFGRIQAEAELANGNPMPKGGKRGWYGFHDLRRGFATQNAAGMDLFELQALMQHKSLETTKLYVNMADRLNKTVESLYVPDVLKSASSM